MGNLEKRMTINQKVENKKDPDNIILLREIRDLLKINIDNFTHTDNKPNS
ncbi:hypothetical protein H8S20_02800 [Clostridium sp. NSJ-6]|uniref:Uncharacterized protein n=1 Tax=Clostridium hominis TaxID=2763036 RepID=A0ABR7D8V5_9CLOT|nr:hypothetical protein [Clostridium hominis]MBC5627814.1 hypothetical protein [Clostridium hominis]